MGMEVCSECCHESLQGLWLFLDQDSSVSCVCNNSAKSFPLKESETPEPLLLRVRSLRVAALVFIRPLPTYVSS